MVQEYNGKLAVVFRNYDLGFVNGPVAAQAATAAQMQGYFGEYTDLLFNNQAEWGYAEGTELERLLGEYFVSASGGAGDLGKFREDMGSDAVKKRLGFEQNMGKKVNLRGTPLFRIDGETVPAGDLVEKIAEIVGRTSGG